MTPQLTLSTIVLDCPDAHELADFYRQLLGWKVQFEEPNWVKLLADNGVGMSFQSEPGYVRPTWPAAPGQQQMMIHLDIKVDDLTTAGAHALSLGAVLADFQPQDDVRVFFDPAGHPFCLWVETPE